MDTSLERIVQIANTLDALVEMARGNDVPSFAEMAMTAGLDPSEDFIGADLSGLDFRDEDLTGFCFRDADLTGTDFRRSRGLADDALDGALVHGAIGIPAFVRERLDDGHRIAPAPVPTP